MLSRGLVSAALFAASVSSLALQAAADTISLTVPAQSNIFGAGHAVAPAPGLGGGGLLPPLIALPQAPVVSVRMVSAIGTVCPTSALPICFDHADGGQEGSYTRTDIPSHGGISGIVHSSSVMFLVGVFLTDAEPADPAPPRLDFSDDALSDEFPMLAPAMNQTFFVGDGLGSGVPQVFQAPAGATRLFLGYADAFNFGDPPALPGYYDDNHGTLQVELVVEAELGPTPVAHESFGSLKVRYRGENERPGVKPSMGR